MSFNSKSTFSRVLFITSTADFLASEPVGIIELAKSSLSFTIAAFAETAPTSTPPVIIYISFLSYTNRQCFQKSLNTRFYLFFCARAMFRLNQKQGNSVTPEILLHFREFKKVRII